MNDGRFENPFLPSLPIRSFQREQAFAGRTGFGLGRLPSYILRNLTLKQFCNRKIDTMQNDSLALRRHHERNVVAATQSRSGPRTVLSGNVARESNLESPTVLLSGHSGEVTSVRFNPQVDVLASGSFDKSVLLWRVFGDNSNFHHYVEHKGPVLDVCWSADSGTVFSASVDRTVCVYDAESLSRIKRIKEHQAPVNSVASVKRGESFVATASDDGSAKLFDLRVRESVFSHDASYALTAVDVSDHASHLFVGGIDNQVHILDVRAGKEWLSLRGHTDTITGLRLSPDGSFLLTNSMDNSLRMWDVRPFAESRMIRTFSGLRHSFEKSLLRCAWSPDGSLVSCGSADRFVNVWDVKSAQLLYKLPGHEGSVNDVDFHPVQPIIASGSSDKTIYLGELASSGHPASI